MAESRIAISLHTKSNETNEVDGPTLYVAKPKKEMDGSGSRYCMDHSKGLSISEKLNRQKVPKKHRDYKKLIYQQCDTVPTDK